VKKNEKWLSCPQGADWLELKSKNPGRTEKGIKWNE
jgi:hypothetical protein